MNVEDCWIIICMNVCVCIYMYVEVFMYECMYVRTCTRDTNSRITITKTELKNKKSVFTSKLV